MSAEFKPTILVTGFGPFGTVQDNPSWKAVKELKNIGLQDSNANLVIQKLPVVYDNVATIMPQLWKKYEPELVVHVGVSGQAYQITLETMAHKNGYNRCDNNKCSPCNGICPIGERPSIQTGFDLKAVCEQVNGTNTDISAEVSDDAGRFLCEFTFYCSLSINEKRSVFIHIPPEDRPYSIQQIALGLREIISLLLDQIKNGMN